jgi:malate/lactate dehydrogenase
MPLPRVTVVGAGQVGATTAHLLALKGLAHVTLIDVIEGLAKGKALDLSQSAPIEGFSAAVQGTTDYGSMAGSRLVIITAGLARKPGMSRDDLLAANAGIGYLMAVAASDFNIWLAVGGLFVLAAMGVVLYGVFAAIERRITGWAYTE